MPSNARDTRLQSSLGRLCFEVFTMLITIGNNIVDVLRKPPNGERTERLSSFAT
jgi:hypothetical protein